MKRPVVIAVMCGILAALCTGLYLNSLESAYRKGTQKIMVLTAKQYIDQGTVIDETMIEEKQVPKDYIQPRAIQSRKELVSPEGKKIFMAMVPIEQGEQLITTKLVTLGMETGIAALIPNDKRAVTIVLDREKVSGILKPGNRVDILGVFDYEDREHRTREASVTVLQNILVLAVGKTYLGTPNSAAIGSGGEKGLIPETIEGRVPVSLALSPHEAELFILSSEKGTINFSLRPTGDDRVTTVQPSYIQDIFKDVSVILAEHANEGTIATNSIRAMQTRQKEAIEILKKYQKN